MLQSFVPEYVFSSVCAITPAFLRKHGIQGVLVDLDGTMASNDVKVPSEQIKQWVQSHQHAGLSVLVLSNNHPERVARFCKPLAVPFVFHALKPSPFGFRKAEKTLGISLAQCAVIGDQIYTDVLGGHLAKVGMTCFVQSIDGGHLFNRVRYVLERPFVERAKRKEQP